MDICLAEFIVYLGQYRRVVIAQVFIHVLLSKPDLIALDFRTILAAEEQSEVVLEQLIVQVHALVRSGKALVLFLVELDSKVYLHGRVQSLEYYVVAKRLAP